MGVIVREITNGASHNCYILDVTSDSTYDVIRNVAGTWTKLVDGGAIGDATGLIVRLEVSGVGATVTLRVYLAGVQVGTDISDTNAARLVAAGAPGIYSYGNHMILDDWAGGDL